MNPRLFLTPTGRPVPHDQHEVNTCLRCKPRGTAIDLEFCPYLLASSWRAREDI